MGQKTFHGQFMGSSACGNECEKMSISRTHFHTSHKWIDVIESSTLVLTLNCINENIVVHSRLLPHDGGKKSYLFQYFWIYSLKIFVAHVIRLKKK